MLPIVRDTIAVMRLMREKIGRELGWKPQETFESGIRKTVEWYLSNTKWVDNVKSGAYQSWIEQNHEGRQ